jgi:3',5'-cyclic AMP phosphodiesterase CpdA
LARSLFKGFIFSVLSLLLLLSVGFLLPTVAAQNGAFTFAVYGDCRTNHKVHSRVVAAIAAARPAFVINTGDLVEHGRRPHEWDNFFKIIAPLRDAQIPFYPARGNHDKGGEQNWETKFNVPNGSGSKLYYSFDHGNAHFIALDTETSLKPNTAQYQWLEKDLAATPAQHVFVYSHLPPYSIGLHGSNKGVRQTLCPLLEKHKKKVRVVFNGHDHLYYRTERNGILYVVTGGGGAPLYQTWHVDEAQKGDAHRVFHHYLLVTVNGVEVTGKAFDLDGKERDEFKRQHEIPDH